MNKAPMIYLLPDRRANQNLNYETESRYLKELRQTEPNTINLPPGSSRPKNPAELVDEL